MGAFKLHDYIKLMSSTSVAHEYFFPLRGSETTWIDERGEKKVVFHRY